MTTQKPQNRISRREAIRLVSAMLGGTALVSQNALLAAVVDEDRDAEAQDLFSERDVRLLAEVADTILPETDTPGAKAAGVGPFIALMVADTYYPNDQKIVQDGLDDLEQRCADLHGHDFLGASPAERLELLELLDKEQFDYMNARGPEAPKHYFRMLKELTFFGYFTSEIGCTQALRYKETPGRYLPCVPYNEGDRAWADHA
jgi:hypothetical protein